MDFCYGFLTFHPTLSLNIPGGISFDLLQYWDGQPVRFVCCERKHGSDQPWGRIFWCVTIELEDDGGDGVGAKEAEHKGVKEPVDVPPVKDELGVD